MEFDIVRHTSRLRCTGQPIQLGPLPLALVEEIVKANGACVLWVGGQRE